MLQMRMRNPNFPALLLFTHEMIFAREGTFSTQNGHIWVESNLHLTASHTHQYRFSANVWVGIISDQVVGPCLLPVGLANVHYRVLVYCSLFCSAHRQMLFMHSGDPARFSHCSPTLLEYHILHIMDWIWWAWGFAFTLTDLNPLDFLRGHMKALVYELPVDSTEDLVVRIVTTDRIQMTSGIWEGVPVIHLPVWFVQCHICYHFEHLL